MTAAKKLADVWCMDKVRRVFYLIRMSRFARIAAIALLALFAMGAVVHAAAATAMSVKMALSDSGLMDMADCDGCASGDDGGAVCDLVCNSSLAGNLSGDTDLSPSPVAINARWESRDFTGRTGPPDHHPPRYLILS
jgi:hypothetical protein